MLITVGMVFVFNNMLALWGIIIPPPMHYQWRGSAADQTVLSTQAALMRARPASALVPQWRGSASDLDDLDGL